MVNKRTNKVDRITNDGKMAIVTLLNKALDVEYNNIMNYPRFIDQLVNINRMPDKQSAWVLEHLGKDSVRHSGVVVQLIEQLGGEFHLSVDTVDRISNIDDMLRQQMGKEKQALSIFRQAKEVSSHNQVEERRSILEQMFRVKRDRPDDPVKRSSVTRLLTKLMEDEEHHIIILKEVMSKLNVEMQE
ncbi:ferritin-like domain-containing protein [Chloroflexota bacterium]